MLFSRLSLTNFGPFESASVEFQHRGLNVISGLNGTGKTQLAGAIIAAIVGRAAVRFDEGGREPSSVHVVVTAADTSEDLRLSILRDGEGHIKVERGPRHATRLPHTSGRLSQVLLAAWSDPDGPRLLLTPDASSNRRSLLEASAIEDALPDMVRQRAEWQRLRRSVFEGRAASGGEVLLGSLVNELAIRCRSRESVPLIIDGVLDYVSDAHREYVEHVVESFSETSQVILLTSKMQLFQDRIVASLPVGPHARSLASYNDLVTQQRPRLRARQRVQWVLGRKFARQESRTCELKEVKGGNPVSAIASVVDQYVVAFLNVGRKKEGSIFWGVRNEDLAITGVNLSDQDCDQLRRVVTDKLLQIVPPLAPTAFQVELHPVSTESGKIADLYVVEVRVPGTQRTLLFSTGSREVYVKTDAGKKKLSALDIQHELLRRLGIDVPF